MTELANQHVSTHKKYSPLTHVGTLTGLGTCMTSGTCNWAWPMTDIHSNETVYSMSKLDKDGEVDSSYYLGIYALLGIAFMFITLFREGVLFGGSLTGGFSSFLRSLFWISNTQVEIAIDFKFDLPGIHQ